MNWFTAIVVFVLVWWTLLFAVLPLWTRPHADADETTGWRGVPERPLMGRKLLLTTLVSLVVWGAIMLIIHSDYLSFRS
jgi:predicted secreted protein